MTSNSRPMTVGRSLNFGPLEFKSSSWHTRNDISVLDVKHAIERKPLDLPFGKTARTD